MAQTDFTVQNEGSIFLLHPETEKAKEHLIEHVAEDAQWFGDSLVVEHRYIADLVETLKENEFTVS